MLDRAAQALKDWRLHAKTLTEPPGGQDQPGRGSPPLGPEDQVGLAGADRFDKQAEIHKNAATTCK
jgi:hypothetical protein